MSRSVVNPRRKRGRNVTGEAVAVVAILAVVGAAWWFIGGSGQGEHPKDNNLSMSPQSNAVNKPSNTTAAGQGNAVNHGVGNQAMSNADGAGRGAPTALKVVSQSFTNNEQTYVVATSAPLNVQLQATGSCWLQTTADGRWWIRVKRSPPTASGHGQRISPSAFASGYRHQLPFQ